MFCSRDTKLKTLLVSGIVFLCTVAPATANLIADGGFETGLDESGTVVVTDGQSIGAWHCHATDRRLVGL